MRLFIIDDCSVAWDEKVEFFLYGGIVIPENEAKGLAEQLLHLKEIAGIKKERPIKWSNNKWHGESSFEEGLHKTLKGQILDMVASSGCKIIVCLSPQYFYHRARLKDGERKMGIDSEKQRRTQQYGLNDALLKFNRFLEQVDELGFVLADTFVQDTKQHMDEHCFNIFPKGTTLSALSKIIHPVVQIDNEQSHLHQINDVVLGAIYFSLREMGLNFLPVIKDSFWRPDGADYPRILGNGVTVKPEIPQYKYIADAKRKIEQKFLRLVTMV